MALNSKAKRMAAAGTGRPYMRATLAASVNADQRASIALAYPVAAFEVSGISFPKVAAWLWQKTEYSGSVNDKLRQFLDDKGYSDGTTNDDFFDYLAANGYSGSISDKLLAADLDGWLWQQ